MIISSSIKSVRDVPYDLYESVFQTGSTIICSPPVTNTDEDWMFYTKDFLKFEMFLMEKGFTFGGTYKTYDKFHSYKKDKLNFLITGDIDYYDKFQEATTLATKLNLKEKKQRVTLFAYVLGDESYDEDDE
jgi:hypothetical protein